MYHFYLINTDKDISVKWSVPKIASSLMSTAIATTLGEIPEHEFVKGEDSIIIFLNEEQIDRMIETAGNLEQNDAVTAFIREIKFLR